jgi:Spy/CpxP family protein refolding chaperone
MKKWMLAAVATLAVALVAVSQVARAAEGRTLQGHVGHLLHGHGGHDAEEHEGADAHLEAIADWLDLSAAQRKDFASLISAALPGLESQTLAALKAHGEELELLHAAELDEQRLRDASARAGAAQGELAVSLGRLLRDVHRLLTPEQLGRLEHMHDTHLFDHLAEHVRGAGRDARAWAARQ